MLKVISEASSASKAPVERETVNLLQSLESMQMMSVWHPPGIAMSHAPARGQLEILRTLLEFLTDYWVNPIHSVPESRRASLMGSIRQIAVQLVTSSKVLEPQRRSKEGFAEEERLTNLEEPSTHGSDLVAGQIGKLRTFPSATSDLPALAGLDHMTARGTGQTTEGQSSSQTRTMRLNTLEKYTTFVRGDTPPNASVQQILDQWDINTDPETFGWQASLQKNDPSAATSKRAKRPKTSTGNMALEKVVMEQLRAPQTPNLSRGFSQLGLSQSRRSSDFPSSSQSAPRPPQNPRRTPAKAGFN